MKINQYMVHIGNLLSLLSRLLRRFLLVFTDEANHLATGRNAVPTAHES